MAGIAVGDQSLHVWVADESAERRQGLRSVGELPDGVDGMLFVLPNASSPTFGMRDVLIPLDIWWFDPGSRLLGSTRMEPCPADPCTSYGSPGEVQWALEVPAGAYRFEPGATLSIVENG